MSETGTESETSEEIRGTALGVVVENYQSGRFRQLTGATAQMRELCELLEERGYGTTVVEDPECSAVNKPLGDWARKWRATGGHGPAVVLWSGHGVLDDGELRLIMRDTADPEFAGEVHPANLLVSTALHSSADQVLLLIDTCHAGAGVAPSLERALSKLAQRNLPPGRSAWFGVLASCRPQEKAEAGGVLLDAFARVLREGPRTDEYRHEWSRRNGQVSGNTVIQAVLAEWPSEVGHRPLNAMTGRDRLMFANPLRAAATEPELVEHLVQAARGAAPDDEGWFFSGRRRVLGEITEWLEARRPGLFLVTGSAGSGKSAVLGRIATLSDPAHRADVLAHQPLTPRDPDPGEDSVDVALHLRGFTVQQLAEAIARRLSLPRPQTPAALIAEVEKGWPESRRRLVLVLDGLDEAAPDQAHPVVEQLLAPLSRLSCVLLGSRDRPFRPQQEPGESLDQAVSRLLDVRARASDLDAESDTESDIREYCRRRLLARGLTDPDATTATGLVAGRASTRSGGFLFARMATDSLLRRFAAAGAEGWDWAEAIPSSISAAFTEDLESGPVRERDGAVLPHAAEDLLTALAWSAGNGMPARGVWEAATSALSADGIEYGPEDVDWLLNEYGRYVVEDTDGTQAVYRLYHREFIDHLRVVPGRTTDPAYRIAHALVGLLREQSADASTIEEANPYLRYSLPTHAALAEERGVTLIRELVDLRPDTFLPQLAQTLGERAVSLSGASRRAEALALSHEAVELYRALAQAHPVAHLRNFATSLTNLSAHQRDMGDWHGALITSKEAVGIDLVLAQTAPTVHLPGLAASLNNLAVHLLEAGDREGALSTITETIAIRRSLAEDNPAARLPDLATSLNNLAKSQAATGDRRGALNSIAEAVTIQRTLTRGNAAAHLSDLATSLNGLSVCRKSVGDQQGAFIAAAEAVTIQRTLAHESPAVHLPHLAGFLDNLATCQAETGDWQSGLRTSHEAVAIQRILARDNPVGRLPHLAGFLDNLATHQAQAGDRRTALATASEAVDLFRDLARLSPGTHNPGLAIALDTLASLQSRTGDLQSGLMSRVEAVALQRELAGDNPAVHLPKLAGLLNNLALSRAETGDGDGALAASDEAVDLYTALAKEDPATYLANLANVLDGLSVHLGAVGHSQSTLATVTKAVAIHRTLAQSHPAAHLKDLASSLSGLANLRATAADHVGALAASEEALAILRPLAEDNPARHLPMLARAISRLAIHQHHGGDLRGALATSAEAITIRRTLAESDPAAHLPQLGHSVNNLAIHRAEAGDLQGALASIAEAIAIRTGLARLHPPAYLPDLSKSLAAHALMVPLRQTVEAYEEAERSLSVHPGAVRELSLQRAHFQIERAGAPDGVRTLIALAQSPPPADATTIQSRQLLRAHSRTDAASTAQAIALWREVTGSEAPDWLELSPITQDLVMQWLDSPSWAESREFWNEHAYELRSAEVSVALEELALVEHRAKVHLQIVRVAGGQDADTAFRPHLTAELLDIWSELADSQEAQDFLTEHTRYLLHDEALELLGEDLEAPASAMQFAVVTLARADGVPAAYEYLGSLAVLRDRIRRLLAAPRVESELLRAAGLLESLIHGKDFAGAARVRLAALLSGDPQEQEAAWPAVESAERDLIITEIVSLIGLHPGHAPALGNLIRSMVVSSLTPGP
ncbi:caspase family protein [Streptomyces goshikiensis]|uniref:caspase family protein n=1 Tax=Streptomyces goshikiensis TaxID=1942 RepID=UPI0036A251DE